MTLPRRIAAVLSTLLAAAALAAQTAPGAALGTLRIGTWNLEFLGDPGDHRNGLPPRDNDDFRLLGEKVRALGIAVLAVQEINDEPSLRRVAAAAGPAFDVVLGTTGSWDDGRTAQRIGFLFDGATVELLQAEELLDLPREAEGVPIFHRVPVTACFRVRATGFDFRAVTVHMKAGQKPDDEKKRRLEATALHGWLRSLQQRPGEDQDVVLLGDFNSTFGADPERVFEADGVVTYVDQPTAMPTIQHFAEPIDQIAYGPGFTELLKRSYAVHSDPGRLTREAWRKTYSDHYPVTVDLAANEDGDRDATFGCGPHVLPPERRRAPPPVAGPGPGARGHWPFRAGDLVEVQLVAPLPTGVETRRGTLLAELPSAGGWIALVENGRTVAIPREQVRAVQLAR